MRLALLLTLALALAGCGGTATGDSAGAENVVAENKAEFAAETKGWDELFAKPAAQALAIFAKLSLRPGDYAVMGDAHMSHGTPIRLADTKPGTSNTLTFNASGDAKQLNGVSFDILIEDAAQAQASRTRAAESIGNALRIAGLDGAEVAKAALATDAEPTTGSVAGANYAVIRKGARTTITFTKKST